MTGERHDELAAINLNMIVVALTPSWFIWILTIMPVWLYFSSFLFCSVLFCFRTRSYIYYTSVSCVWCLLPSVKTFKTRTVHFIFSLSLFVCARVVITSITALGMFTNLCLVLLWLLVGSLAPKFHFQLTKKSRREVREMDGHCINWQMA